MSRSEKEQQPVRDPGSVPGQKYTAVNSGYTPYSNPYKAEVRSYEPQKKQLQVDTPSFDSTDLHIDPENEDSHLPIREEHPMHKTFNRLLAPSVIELESTRKGRFSFNWVNIVPTTLKHVRKKLVEITSSVEQGVSRIFKRLFRRSDKKN